jgi:hypothetical protein
MIQPYFVAWYVLQVLEYVFLKRTRTTHALCLHAPRCSARRSSSSHTPAPLPEAMPFVVALLGNEARPYARVTEEELVALAEERGVEITVR